MKAPTVVKEWQKIVYRQSKNGRKWLIGSQRMAENGLSAVKVWQKMAYRQSRYGRKWLIGSQGMAENGLSAVEEFYGVGEYTAHLDSIDLASFGESWAEGQTTGLSVSTDNTRCECLDIIVAFAGECYLF